MRKTILIIILMLFHVFIFPEIILKDVLVERGLVVDDKGYLYTNEGRHKICKYSPEGKLLFKIGGKGEGPGDIKRLGWFKVHPGDSAIYVVEFYGNRWISKFSKDGKYLGEWKCEIDWKKWDGMLGIDFDKNGNVYVLAFNDSPKRYKDFIIRGEERAIFKFSTQGKQLKKIFDLRIDFNATKPGKGNITIPFRHNYLSSIYIDKILIIDNYSDSLSVFDTDGKLIKKIPVPFKKAKVTEKDKDNWIKYLNSFPQVKRLVSQGFLDLKFWRNNIPFPEFIPSVGEMFPDPEGNIYIMNYSGYGFEPSQTLWCRICLKTGEQKVLASKKDDRIHYIGKNYVYVSRKYNEEETWLAKVEKKNYFLNE